MWLSAEEEESVSRIASLAFILASLVILPFTASALPPEQVELTVDAGLSASTPLPLKIGHCISQHKIGGVWDTGTNDFDTNAGEVLGFAGIRGAGVMRFPNGNEADDYHYHWRRGVGPVSLRPRQGWAQGDHWYHPFGTDEFLLFVDKANSAEGAGLTSAVPLITVNWYDWNNPDPYDANDPNTRQPPVPGWPVNQYPPPAGNGAQEAANWVEYCNGAVTPQLITTATNSGWVPSQFIKPDTGEPWQDPQAVESADHTHSWLSYEAAPTGYFAWLRRYFAWQRAGSPMNGNEPTWNDLNVFTEASYGAPYNVKYWEVGNEVYKYLFKTAPMNGYVTPEYYYGDLNDENANPGGFFAYSKKMKSALGGTGIKVGAWIDGPGNTNLYSGTWGSWAVDSAGNYLMTPTDQPQASGPWLDRLSTLVKATVPTGGDDPKDYLDWLSIHFGDAGDKDYHIWIWGSRNMYDGSTKNPYIPALKAVHLAPSTTYTFRVRAKGMKYYNAQPPTNYTDYPLMQIQLIRNGTVQETCSASDPRACQSDDVPQGGYTQGDVGKSVWVCQSKANPNDRYTAGAASDQRARTPLDGEDYAFTLTTGQNFTEGDYTPWVRTTNNPYNNGRMVDVLFATWDQGTSSETPLTTEWAPEVEAALAISAPSIITGVRLNELRGYVQGTGVHQLGMPNVEIAATELDFMWSRDNGFEDRSANWECALSVAEVLRMMADGGKLDFANYHNLQDYNSCFIIQHNGVYDNYASGLCYPSPPPTLAWIASPAANVYHLFANYMGDQRAPVSVTSGSVAKYNLPTGQTYRCLDYEDDIPYLTYTASTKYRFETIDNQDMCVWTAYVMLINQHSEAYPCAVNVQNLPPGEGGAVTGAWHVLTCWNPRDGVLPLDNVNGSDFVASEGDPYKSGRIRIVDIDASVTTNEDGSVSVTYPNGGLPKYSVAVLELTANRQVVTMSGPDRYTIPIGRSVRLTDWPVTAVFGDRFYLENPDKSSGIAVIRGTEDPPSIGDNVTVLGILMIRDGQQVVQEATVTDDGGDPTTVKPLFLPNRDLGGASPTAENILPSVPSGACRVYNVGLLVQVVGVVTSVDETNRWFYVDDGGALPNGENGPKGVRVNDVEKDHTLPDLGAYVVARGISSAFLDESRLEREVLWIAPAENTYDISSLLQSSQSRAGRFQDMLMSSGETMDQIDSALAQADGTQVSLQGVEISGVLQGYFGVKGMSEILPAGPRLLVSRTCQALPSWSVDVQGTITTLASGQRAIVPASVWLYTDAQGRPAPPYACMIGSSWPHKQQIQ